MTVHYITLFWPTFVGTTLIALVHLLMPRFRFMQDPGNPWVPVSAGVALAYVFMDIFPHLANRQSKLASVVDHSIYSYMTHHVYLVCLAGFSVYLGIALSVNRYRESRSMNGLTLGAVPVLVKIEYASLVAYSCLIGYLMSEQITHRPEPVLLFGAAMAIHFAGIDGLLRGHFPKLYDTSVRYIFAASVYVGWLVGIVLEIADATLTLWYAFLAGGLIVIATVYELPRIRNRRQYGAFLAGAGVFSAFILAIERFG